MSDSSQTLDGAASSTGISDIKIEVWFDVRCPWCFLGKRRLERAIEMFHETEPGIRVEVLHRSYELAPGMPEHFDGGEPEYLLRYEGVPLEQSRRTLPVLRRLAASEGIEMRFDELIEVNTRRAHRLFLYGQQQGVGEELLERLFIAYFTECRDLADPDTLAALAAEAGLDPEAARAASEPGEWDEVVTANHMRGEILGATGVPFSLFDAEFRVSGAHSADVLASALHKLVAIRRSTPANP